MCSVRLSVRTPPFHGGKEGFDSPTEYHIEMYLRRYSADASCKTRAGTFQYGIIVKCYQGIVIGRYDYAGSTVRGTGPDITAIRLSELATLLTNRHDNT